MKQYLALFWRGNPQLRNGGYETYRVYEAKNMREAKKMAAKSERSCAYGTMWLMEIIEA